MEQQNSSEPRPRQDAEASPSVWTKVGKRLLTVALVLGSGVLGGFVVHREQVSTQFEKSVSDLSKAQDKWLTKAEELISAAGSIEPAYPDSEQIGLLRKEVLSTAIELGRFRSPDDAITKAAQEYKKSLEELAGILNQYDGSHKAFISVVSAAQDAANNGGSFYGDIDGYSRDFLRKSFQAIGLS